MLTRRLTRIRIAVSFSATNWFGEFVGGVRSSSNGMDSEEDAGDERVVDYEPDTPLPLDEKCLHGTLSNGLTYYIQDNKKPEARAELRLVVKIGSVYEEDDEQGLAHLVEHLAFRGTKLYDTFEVVKCEFAACLRGREASARAASFPRARPHATARALTAWRLSPCLAVTVLESVGAKFGACQNAYTSYDETVRRGATSL